MPLKNNLQLLQNSMQQHLCDQDNNFIQHISSNAPELRLQIYYNAYYARLIDTLREDFPKVVTLLGDNDFAELASAYITATPSDNYSLRDLGQHFAAFSQQRVQTHITEMAYFERAIGNTLDSCDQRILTMADLQQIPQSNWPNLKLTFTPSLQLYDFAYNTPQTWQQLEEKPSLATNHAANNYKITWIIYRYNLQAAFYPLDLNEKLALGIMQNGACFAELCEQLCEHLPQEEVANTALQMMCRWFQEQFIIDID